PEGLEAKSAARRIHRHVPCTDHGHSFAYLDGGIEFGELIAFHQIDTTEEFICRHDPVEIDSRNAHKHRKASPGAQKNCIVFGQQFIDGKGTSYDVISKYPNTEGLCRRFDFSLDNLFLWKPKFRNAVNEHAARSMKGFEDGDIVSHPAKVDSTAQACRSRADYRHFLACRRPLDNSESLLCEREIPHKTLNAPYGDRFPILAQNASRLALPLLRTDPAANSRQVVSGFHDLNGLDHIAHTYGFDKLGNFNLDRTAFHTVRLLALQATFSLHSGKVQRKAQGHFVKILDPLFRLLHGHILTGNLHPFFFGQLCHLCQSIPDRTPQIALLAFPPALNRCLFLGTVKRHPRQKVVPVHFVGVELGAIHTNKLSTVVRDYPAAATHPRTIYHDSIQTDDGRYVERLGRGCYKLHHDGRPDGPYLGDLPGLPFKDFLERRRNQVL